ncbi:MAG: hypothetical protein RIT14_2811, partial [Pseudomonadota bacterium]
MPSIAEPCSPTWHLASTAPRARTTATQIAPRKDVPPMPRLSTLTALLTTAA